MKKKILVLGIILALVTAIAVPMAVFAADSGTVGITAGTSAVSMTLTPGTWTITSVAADTAYSTFDLNFEGHFTLTNDGNVSEDFTIEGIDATGSTVTWTLSKTPGSADDYSLGFGQTTGAGVPYTECANYTEFDDSGSDALTTDLAVSGTFLFDLELFTFAGTDVTEVMAATVTVTAVEHVP